MHIYFWKIALARSADGILFSGGIWLELVTEKGPIEGRLFTGK